MKKTNDDYIFAKRLAEVAHHRQRYGIHAYTYHLQQVDDTLCKFGFEEDMELRISAWLHDMIEDTGMSYDQIKVGFGEIVADIVYAVTNEMGRSRKERNLKTYPKIKANKKAIILKLADRLVNVGQALGTNTRYIDMYRKEFTLFKSSLYEDIGDERIGAMWKRLEELFKEETTEKI